jgi:GTPase SAR1 family protein
MTNKFDSIKPLVKEQEIEWSYNTIPKPEFRICVVAPSNTGKSVLISNIISSNNFPYRAYFGQNIFIFSPTFNLGSMPGMDNIKKHNIFDSFDVEILNNIINEQKNLIETYGKKKSAPILIILDDIVGELDSRRKEALKKCYFGLRHFNGSIILLSQQYKSIPKSVRINCSDTILFEVPNEIELKDITDEQNIPKDTFINIYEFAIHVQPYSFLCIRHKNPKKTRYQLRFTNQYLN